MKRSDPGVLDRLRRIAAGWTPPARGLDCEPETPRRPTVGLDSVHPGSRRAVVGLVFVVIAAAVATVVWMVTNRARPVLAVPELRPDSASSAVEGNQVVPRTSGEPWLISSPSAASDSSSASLAQTDTEVIATSRSGLNARVDSTSVASAPLTTPVSTDARLLVHVAGPVRSPGVVILPTGSRVIDAVNAAGGLRKGAEIGQTNLAAVLSDGQRVEVGAPNPAAGSTGGAVANTEMPRQASAGIPVDLNTATAEQLDALPGVGPVTAAKILAWRAANGRFNTVDELSEVSGIGPVRLAELRAHVTV